ncbi:MAG: GDSL-type esterase/lipase family protein [Gammaproteobacteria bacterium]|nr:GDSL-type esterase/lipase family protein [Gammaproteobacteria bacterium]
MSKNRQIKNILCYGDSNTWGFVPQDLGNMQPSDLKRYSREERWTGLLQEKLGDSFYVVEEGLNGRTTNLNYHIPPDRNGKTYLAPCLYSHAPLDLVIFAALGGNDFKTCFQRTAEDIRHGMAELIQVVKQTPYGPGFTQPPQVLLISIPTPLKIAESYLDENGVPLFSDTEKKANQLRELYASLAAETKTHFLDVSDDVPPSPIDGLHLDESGHEKLAHLIWKKCEEIFSG